MREIKFRVFDHEEKDMVSWEQIRGGLIDVYTLFWEKPPNLTLMQYTGLSDCKGVDIYDKDIYELDAGYYTVDYEGFLRNFDEIELERIMVIGNIYMNPELLL